MILFSMGASDVSPSTSTNDFLRTMFTVLDRGAYLLLVFIFRLFFNVATVDLFSNNTIMSFYTRIQTILGVFMLFQLAMTIIKGIVDPDSFNDKKTGASSLIQRIAVALVLLVLLVPIRYNKSEANMNEYEKQLNNNGVLFGTLYSLQFRLLNDNVLGKLVFGDGAAKYNYTSSEINQDKDGIKTLSYEFAATVVRTFYRINLKEEDGDPADQSNWMCQEWPEGAYEIYTARDANPQQIISIVNSSCDDDGTKLHWWQKLPLLQGSTRYVFAYMPLLPAIAGFVLALLILSFTIDVGVRAIKLAVLKLIAPIPIISYMDPKGSKDSAFNAWVKTLTSTYIDLFARLAVIYFIIAIITDILENGLVVGTASNNGVMNGLTRIVIFIALFAFAKQAPKFFRQMLGLKDEGSGFGGLFKGFSTIGNALGFGAGVVGGAFASARGVKEKDPNASFGEKAKAAVSGSFKGGMNVGKTLLSSKDPKASDTFRQARNANDQMFMENALGVTARGKAGSRFKNTIGLDDRYSKLNRDRESAANQAKTGEDLFKYLSGKGATDGAGYNVTTAGIDALGRDGNGNAFQITGSLNDFKRAKAAALAKQQRGEGDGSFKVYDTLGTEHRINAHDAVATKIEEELSYAAGTKWAENNSTDAGYVQKRDSFRDAGGTFVEGTGGTTVSDLKKAYKSADGKAKNIENSNEFKSAKATHDMTKKSDK